MERTFLDLRRKYIESDNGFSDLIERHMSDIAEMEVPDFRRPVIYGERHGTWFKSFRWEETGLIKIVEFSLTNRNATSDGLTRDVFLSIRIGATTDQQFLMRTVFERKRAINNRLDEVIYSHMRAAIERVREFTFADLDMRYEQRASNQE